MNCGQSRPYRAKVSLEASFASSVARSSGVALTSSISASRGALSGELSRTSPRLRPNEMPGNNKSASKTRARPIRFIRVSTTNVGVKTVGILYLNKCLARKLPAWACNRPQYNLNKLAHQNLGDLDAVGRSALPDVV